MDVTKGFLVGEKEEGFTPMGGDNVLTTTIPTTLTAVNARLGTAGLSIAREDAAMLAERRAESLAETERVEFGEPVVAAITEAIATSPYLEQSNVADALAELQSAFYMLRDELPINVPDTEIIEALRGCFDACGGDAVEVTTLPPSEVMVFSSEYVQAAEVESGEYRIVDEEGRVYSFDPEGQGFDPAEWDYDEQANGWDGERWSDDWNDKRDRSLGWQRRADDWND